MELRSANIIDATIEGHYAFIPFAHQISTQLHYHDFYEIFLIADGHIEHQINNTVDRLTRGTLVLIRPKDQHCFHQYADEEYVLINLAFLESTFDALVGFLGLDHDRLTHQSLPPQVLLDGTTNATLRLQLQNWGRSVYGDKVHARQRLCFARADHQPLLPGG